MIKIENFFTQEVIMELETLCKAYLHGENLSGADLRGADLRGADLSGANLSGANLSGANLSGANLCRANLRGASLSGANLYCANLHKANLSGANLRRAGLSGANLYYADLHKADLREADLREASLNGADLRWTKLPHYKIVPSEGSFIAYKKLANDAVATVEIPADAMRCSTLIGRKCRAEKVKVLSIQDANGKPTHAEMGWRNKHVVYAVGEITTADFFSQNIRVECDHGIHFFMTKEEAMEW